MMDAILVLFAFCIGCGSMVVSLYMILRGRDRQRADIMTMLDKILTRVDHYLATGD